MCNPPRSSPSPLASLLWRLITQLTQAGGTLVCGQGAADDGSGAAAGPHPPLARDIEDAYKVLSQPPPLSFLCGSHIHEYRN